MNGMGVRHVRMAYARSLLGLASVAADKLKLKNNLRSFDAMSTSTLTVVQLQVLLLAHYRTPGNYIAKAAQESVAVVEDSDRAELLDLGRTEGIDITVAIDTDATVAVDNPGLLGFCCAAAAHRIDKQPQCMALSSERRVGCARVESDQKTSSTASNSGTRATPRRAAFAPGTPFCSVSTTVSWIAAIAPNSLACLGGGLQRGAWPPV